MKHRLRATLSITPKQKGLIGFLKNGLDRIAYGKVWDEEVLLFGREYYFRRSGDLDSCPRQKVIGLSWKLVDFVRFYPREKLSIPIVERIPDFRLVFTETDELFPKQDTYVIANRSFIIRAYGDPTAVGFTSLGKVINNIVKGLRREHGDGGKELRSRFTMDF